jgi:L-iditol 2-dehydrogenase
MIDTMKAVVRRDGAVVLADVAMPAGDVVVEVAYAGVCRTDLAVADGTIAVAEGRVLGHELSGWCDGEPVTVVPFVGTHWLGVHRDGGFAERVAVSRGQVLRLPREMPLMLGAFVEPVAAALGVLSVVERGMRVLIGGTNRIAELTARVIAAVGAVRVDGPCDVAIEHDGDLAALIAQLVPRGTLILKSRASRTLALPAGDVVARELVVRGSSHGSFHAAIDWLHTRRIVVDDLLAAPRPLAEYAGVFADARTEVTKQMFAIKEP